MREGISPLKAKHESPSSDSEKKRLERLKRRASAQQKTIKTFPTILCYRCTIKRPSLVL